MANKPGKQKTILKYGCYWPADAHPAQIELQCIAHLGRWIMGKRECGNGLPYHVKKFMQIAWPDMYWHRWTHLIVDEFLRSPGRTGCWGPSSSQKSFVFTRCGLTMFYARPEGTTVMISSTTLAALQRRIWDYVVSSDKSARTRLPWLPGSMIESKLMLLADPSDADGRSFKNGVVGIAVKVGNAYRGLADFIGCKNEVMVVIADELQFVPMAIVDSLANLESNEICYTAGMGNLPDTYNPLAAFCEPKLGWDSFADTDKSRVYATKWKNGRAIQFVGADSPNLIDDDGREIPEGFEPFPNLIGRRYIEQCEHNYGRDSDKFMMFAAGKVPKGSLNRTVFTKAQAYKFHATDLVKWGHHPVKRGYCLDAAYSGVGGDRTCGGPFMFGLDNEGRWKWQLGQYKIFRGSADASKSHCEAIAQDVMAECIEHGIEPEHVFYDGTGRSELTIAFARIWSSKVQPIEFGGPATDRPSFTGEKHMDGEQAGEVKTCREVFDRFVTELWFAIRQCLFSEQLRGLTEEIIDEVSLRKWEIVRGAKYKIEPKDGEKDGKPVGMKSRGLPSPDLGDMLAVGLEGARRMGFPLGKEATTTAKRTSYWIEQERNKDWERTTKGELVVV